ncbi:MAG: DUF2064 domain-containing protein [Maribacter sp.]|uniref:TIGR04282 family arsenosugar biosynthesis glycosyltransferase n=1 Tax=Maribacter sp. TaxID=1897614 RepID=UPI003299722A
MPHSKQHHTAILVFANSPSVELRHKSIHKGVHLFDSLTNQTLSTVAKTSLPYFHVSEQEQFGITFGERFTNAIKAIFDKGYEQIITIGNDTPQLKVSHIKEATKQLGANRLVLGPSTDGGFYLMGLHKSQFEPEAFLQLAWQTSYLSKQLVHLLKQGSTKIFKLRTLCDIDTQADVKSILSYTYQFSKKLTKALLEAVGLPGNKPLSSLQKVEPLAISIRYNKGSPTAISF